MSILDSTFGVGGHVITSFHAEEFALQSDGKIVIAGGDSGQGVVARYNADGSPDLTFGTGGARQLGDSPFEQFALRPDGGMLGTHYPTAVTAYNADGSRDLEFHTVYNLDGSVHASSGYISSLAEFKFIYDIAVRPDGKAVVLGPDTNFELFVLVQLGTDGTRDPGFANGGVALYSFGNRREVGESFAIQADGKIVVAGTSTHYVLGHDFEDPNIPVWQPESSVFAVVRFNANGGIDTTFGANGGQTTAISTFSYGGDVALQSDGKIVVAGGFDYSEPYFALVRYNADGSHDPTFGSNGVVTTEIGYSQFAVSRIGDIALQPDHKIVVAGQAWNGSDWDIAVVRYNPDGSLDTSFDDDGKLLLPVSGGNDYASSIALTPNGDILIGGPSGDDRYFVLTRIHGSGTGLTLTGTASADTMAGASDNDSIAGRGGNDSILAGSGNDSVLGEAGNDWIHGNANNDTLRGYLGEDTLKAGHGDDMVYGGPGNDLLYGSIGRDTMHGGSDDDVAFAGDGNDSVLGGDGADWLHGEAGTDVLSGEAGNDVLFGDAGADTMYGGPDHDTFFVDDPGDVVVENPGEGADNIQAWISFPLPANVESLFMLTPNSLGIGNELDNYLRGTDGTDYLHGSLGDDRIEGLGGSDLLHGEQGDDWMHGHQGDDTLFGGSGNDDLRGGNGADLLQGNQGNDTLYGSLGDDDLRGGNDDDLLDAGDGDDILRGSFGNDTLSGGPGADTLDGGDGDDLLQGRLGSDLLTGGAGNDIFWFNAVGALNADTITDFNPDEDAIELDSSLLLSLIGMAGGSPAAGNFLADIGPVPANTNQLLLYDTSTGDFYYDPDGSGAAAAELIVTLTGAPTLSESDIFVS